MELGGLVFTLEGWQAVLALVGPLLVGAITAISTSSKAKGVLALIILVATVAVQAVLTGGWTNDVFANFLALSVIWQGMYGFWKALGLTQYLQDSFPVFVFRQ